MHMATNETSFTTTPAAFTTTVATTNGIPDNIPMSMTPVAFQTLAYAMFAMFATVATMGPAIIYSGMRG